MLTITRINSTDYAIVTSTVMSDGSVHADYYCRLVGSVLRSHEQKGHIRIGGPIVVTLGAKSFETVSQLAIGQSVTLG